MRSDDNSVSELSRVLGRLQELEILLRVGLKRDSTKDRIDLLVGCRGGDIYRYASPVEALLKDHWPNGNFFVCDDSIRFDLPIGTGGIAICDSALLVRKIEEWVEGRNLDGKHRSWATGYWLPEALCGDLVTAEILRDTKATNEKIREILVPYPQSLSHSIIDLCADEIRQKTGIAKRLFEKDCLIEQKLCISDLTATMVRLAFAKNSIYLRGFRELNEQSKLLGSSGLPIYELALELSRKEKVESLVDEIEKLL